jgi:hypothetical protein
VNALRPRRLDRIACLGFVFLAVANIVTFILTRHTSLSEHVVDPLIGFLHGVAIATLLLGVYRQTRTAAKGKQCV